MATGETAHSLSPDKVDRPHAVNLRLRRCDDVQHKYWYELYGLQTGSNLWLCRFNPQHEWSAHHLGMCRVTLTLPAAEPLLLLPLLLLLLLLLANDSLLPTEAGGGVASSGDGYACDEAASVSGLLV
jgi:hypothetical protein